MTKEMEYPPLIDWSSSIKGFLSGSLMVGGVVNDYGTIIQIVIFITGFLLFLDIFLTVGKELYVVVIIMSMFSGGMLTLFLSLTGYSLFYMVMVFSAVLLYGSKRVSSILKKFRK
ncbi:MAG: hypothetical protein DRH12_19535 [Deltaproteobacteria bacterium]|nr:MAG: hypothetical protein DRH12_19535 [Deltaproteobacteria bacterium]